MRRRQLLAAGGFVLFGSGCSGLSQPGNGCPQLPTEQDIKTICDGKKSDAAIYLRAKSNSVSVTDGTIHFGFVNTSDGDISYGPCFWSLYKKSTNGWQSVSPSEGHAIAQILHADSTRELTLRVGQPDPTPSECNPYYVSELDAGRYLFGIQGETPDGTTTQFLASFQAKL